jgi:hypothetical protein
MGRLAVFGDSHSIIFSGTPYREGLTPRNVQSNFPGVDVFWVEDALAYNLMPRGRLGKHGLKVLELMPDDVAAVFLCFGEIDVRNQILRRVASGGDLYEQLETITSSLIDFAIHLRDRFGIPVFILSPVGSQRDFSPFNIKVPSFGSEADRNIVTLQLERKLHEKTQFLDCVFVLDVASLTIDQIFQTKSVFYEDGCHLNLDGLSLVSKLFENNCRNLKIDLPCFFVDANAGLAPELVPTDLITGARIYLLNSSDGRLRYVEFPTPDLCLYPAPVSNPEVIIDLGFITELKEVLLHFEWESGADLSDLTLSKGLRPAALQQVQIASISARSGALILDAEMLEGECRFLRIGARGVGRLRFLKLEFTAVTYSRRLPALVSN